MPYQWNQKCIHNNGRNLNSIFNDFDFKHDLARNWLWFAFHVFAQTNPKQIKHWKRDMTEHTHTLSSALCIAVQRFNVILSMHGSKRIQIYLHKVNYLEFKVNTLLFAFVIWKRKCRFVCETEEGKKDKQTHTWVEPRRIKMDLFVFQFLGIAYPSRGASSLCSLSFSFCRARTTAAPINRQFMSEFYRSDRVKCDAKIKNASSRIMITNLNCVRCDKSVQWVLRARTQMPAPNARI